MECESKLDDNFLNLYKSVFSYLFSLLSFD